MNDLAHLPFFGAATAPVWAPYALIVLAGVLPTAVWRWAGVALAGRMSPDSEVLTWVRAVATALIAAVIAKLVLYPSGALADMPITLRLGAAGIGFLAFVTTGKNVLVGVLIAEAVLIAGQVLVYG